MAVVGAEVEKVGVGVKAWVAVAMEVAAMAKAAAVVEGLEAVGKEEEAEVKVASQEAAVWDREAVAQWEAQGAAPAVASKAAEAGVEEDILVYEVDMMVAAATVVVAMAAADLVKVASQEAAVWDREAVAAELLAWAVASLG
jgi:hypothetical protein